MIKGREILQNLGNIVRGQKVEGTIKAVLSCENSYAHKKVVIAQDDGKYIQAVLKDLARYPMEDHSVSLFIPNPGNRISTRSRKVMPYSN